VGDLAPGTYFVSTSNQYPYVTQVWANINCPTPCGANAGTPVVVGNNQIVGGIDFNLIRRDAIVGRITDAFNVPISGAIVDVFRSIDGAFQNSAVVDASGYYLSAQQPGFAYYVATEAGAGYLDQVYAGISCPQGPAYFGLCPLAGATPVGLSYESSIPHVVNFVMMSNDPIFSNGFQ